MHSLGSSGKLARADQVTSAIPKSAVHNPGSNQQHGKARISDLEACFASLRVSEAATASGRPFLEGCTLPQPPDDTACPVFYTHTLCPYACCVWLALLEKGVEFQPVAIDLADKPSWYRRVTGSGLVPVVSTAGVVLTESLDICRWVDSNLEGPSLVPADRQQDVAALIRAASRVNSAGFDLLSGREARAWAIGLGQSEAQRRAFEAQLHVLDTALQRHGGPFLTGPQISMADLVLQPFLERFAVAMPAFAGLDVAAALGGSVGAWLDAMAERPSCRVASPDRRLFLAALRKHRSLDFFDFHSYSAAELHPHLQEAAGT